VINVEDACATSSIALQCAMNAVAVGMVENALVLGVEKLFDEDKMKSFLALSTDMPVEMRDAIMRAMSGTIEKGKAREELKKVGLMEDMADVILTALGDGSGVGQRSPFMDVYAMEAHLYAREYGIPIERLKGMLAWIAAKNHTNGSLNPFAQYQKACSAEEVLESRPIVEPLHLLMCSPIGDGAAAAVITNKALARRSSDKPVWIAASVANSESWDRQKGDPDCVARAPKRLTKWPASAPRTWTSPRFTTRPPWESFWPTKSLGLQSTARRKGSSLKRRRASGARSPSTPRAGLNPRAIRSGLRGLRWLPRLSGS